MKTIKFQEEILCEVFSGPGLYEAVVLGLADKQAKEFKIRNTKVDKDEGVESVSLHIVGAKRDMLTLNELWILEVRVASPDKFRSTLLSEKLGKIGYQLFLGGKHLKIQYSMQYRYGIMYVEWTEDELRERIKQV